jgi:hypothetical protein
VASDTEDGYEPPVYVQGGPVLDQLRDYQFLNKDRASRSYLLAKCVFPY